MRKSKQRKIHKQQILILVLAAICILSAFLALYIWDKNHSEFEGAPMPQNESVMTYNGQEYIAKKNVETFLIMGLDKFSEKADLDSFNNNMQADFLMLFVFNHDQKTCNAIHINRDTMAKVNVLGVAGDTIDTVTEQIALSHTYGNGDKISCRNTSDAVSKLLLNTKIHHYASVTMDAVPIVNDYVGGVEVEVLNDFSGIDDTLVQGKTVLLKGEHALHYVRNRRDVGDSTNAERMIRQRQYLKALYQKALIRSEQDEDFAAKALIKISDCLVSDCSIPMLQDILQNIETYTFGDIYYFEGESKQGKEFIEFYPNTDSITETVLPLLYDKK